MRSSSVIIPLILAVTVSASAQTSKSEATNWHDVTRDVFVDNQLDRGAQVLTADNPTRLALLSTRLDRALVLQVNEKTFGTLPTVSFPFGADRTTASSDSGVELQKTGQFTRIDGPVYLLAVGSHPVLIRPHPGAVGELTLEQLWEFVPVWR